MRSDSPEWNEHINFIISKLDNNETISFDELSVTCDDGTTIIFELVAREKLNALDKLVSQLSDTAFATILNDHENNVKMLKILGQEVLEIIRDTSDRDELKEKLILSWLLTTTLYQSMELRRIDMMSTILGHQSFNPDLYPDQFFPPLLHVILTLSGEQETFKKLLECPSINPMSEYFAHNDYCLTPLIAAIRYNQLDIVQMLLEHPQVNPMIENSQNLSPFVLAFEEQNMEIIELLMDNSKFNPNALNSPDDLPPLFIAMDRFMIENPDIFKYIMEHPKTDPNLQDYNGNTALHYAIGLNDIYLVEMLLKHIRINPNIQNQLGQTPLMLAISFGYHKIVETILVHDGINTDIQDNHSITPLIFAANSNNIELFNLLIFYGADISAINQNGNTALDCLIKSNNRKFVLEILLHSIDSFDYEDLYQLDKSVTDFYIKAIDFLLNFQPLNQKIEYSILPPHLLHFAVSINSEDMVSFLISRKFDINSYNQNNKTPLSLAIELNLTNIAKILIEKGADINYKDHINCRSALHIAVTNNNPEIVKLLLKKGVNIHEYDKDGLTPLDIAINLNLHYISQILIKQIKCYGCLPNIDYENTPFQEIQSTDSEELNIGPQKPSEPTTSFASKEVARRSDSKTNDNGEISLQ